MTTLSEANWPAAQLGEALAALGRSRGWTSRTSELASGPGPSAAAEAVGAWIEAAAAWLGFEAEPVEVPYAEVERLVTMAGPALVRLPGQEARFLALHSGGRRRVAVLKPDGTVVRLAVEEVRAALCSGVESALAGDVGRLLDGANLRGGRASRARRALLEQLLAARPVGGCWLLRPAATSSLAQPAREAGLAGWLAGLAAAHLGGAGLLLLSWWLLGWMTLTGRLQPGWLLAWGLLLGSLIPCRLFAAHASGVLALRGGAILKRRLLAGALALNPDEVRHEGSGQLLGRALESEVLESAALTGGFLGLAAVLELTLAACALGFGAGSGLHVALLLGGVAVTGWLAGRYYRRCHCWTEQRLDLTSGLVERMVGQRTRQVQQRRADWHSGEDQALEQYLGAAQRMDSAGLQLLVLLPRGWFLIALLGMAPAFVAGDQPVALAAATGGIVLAYRALRNLVDSLERLTGAVLAWQRVRLFWKALARPEAVAHPGLAVLARQKDRARGEPLLEARDLVYRHNDRGEPVLRGTAVRIAAGDRLLLEGPSGGGKSTLAALLAGLRAPQSGLLLLGGLDRATLGAGWRRRVVLAPQFHDNHVLLGTFAHNALLGRGWPPRPGDLAEAERICRALGLGPLLDRMPGGLLQTVGETGWQLSHGERSRLFLARALLQGADVILLDESFAALDPQTLQKALALVMKEAATVLVIAHP
jgi:ATP-binding cassette subfamily B protein